MKQFQKIGLVAFLIVVLLISSMTYTTTILKEESELNYLKNTELHVNSFNEQITQIMLSITRNIDNISLVIEKEKLLKKRVKNILYDNTFIRSISILNDNKKIVYSSNNNNLNHTLDISEYYPKPLFSETILRFGEVIKGRDLFQKDDLLTIVPVSKVIIKDNKKYTVIIAISNDYFINKFLNNIHQNTEELQIVRIDGKLLFSTHNDLQTKSTTIETKLFQESIKNISSSGIEVIDGEKYISAYSLTDTFPLCIAIKLDYEKAMKNWELKNRLALMFFSLLIIIITVIIIQLLLKYTKTKNKEIKYQKQLLKNQEKLRNAYIVYDNTNDGILITDKNLNIIDVNRSFIINTGYTKDEVYGQKPNILKSDEHDQSFYQNMWESLNTNSFWNGEIVNKNKQGGLYTELLTINKVCDKEGNIQNYIGVFTNITKEKNQGILLQEKERFIFQQSKMAAMGEMLENIAHQWRQPLSIISTAATGIKMEKEFGISKESVEIERLTIINDSAQFLSQTIDDFRNFFKPDKEKEEFFIQEAVEQTLKIVSSKFRNRNIEIIQNIENIQVKVYKSELIQVIMNILNNARDVLEEQDIEERIVLIDTFKELNSVIIMIKDSGGGIDPKIINKIFDPYFTTKHQSQGTGIGLYMSEEIIRKHMNGSITVENTIFEYKHKEYKGALFTIAIPLQME
ncbi:hypothetical protein ALC152_19210 [Arcobacter sp. 15-2]|uniref:ATP-binding protein n=1 Tax=Arcobacter sp. 15-2 TaxID=3374109 RepID=UPI00399C7D7E